jgi:hypothetical protein
LFGAISDRLGRRAVLIPAATTTKQVRDEKKY